MGKNVQISCSQKQEEDNRDTTPISSSADLENAILNRKFSTRIIIPGILGNRYQDNIVETLVEENDYCPPETKGLEETGFESTQIPV